MSFLKRLTIGRDDNGYVTNEITWPGENQSYQTILEAGVEQTLAVPEIAFRVLIVVPNGGAVSCGYGDTPLTLANPGSWLSQTAETNPILRPLEDPLGNRITTLRFISYTEDTVVNVIFYGANYSET